MNRARSLQHYQHVKEGQLRQSGEVMHPGVNL